GAGSQSLRQRGAPFVCGRMPVRTQEPKVRSSPACCARPATGHAAAPLRIFVVRCGLPCDPPVGRSFMQWRDGTTLYGCALDEYTGREGTPPCLSLRHATGEPKDR